MIRVLSRRTVLTSLAAVPAAVLLSACSDSGEDAKAAAPTDAAKPAEAPASTAAAPASAGDVNMAELLKPGALPDKALGKEDAKVTIVEYASMTCPHCAHFAETTYPELKTKYIDTGKVRFIFREFPFDPRAEAGFMLARCAGDNYFPMIEVLFKQQQTWAAAENVKDAMFQLSKLAGFTQESFNACLTDQALLDQVRAVQKRGADEFKVDSTPTFFINGKTYKGALSIEEMSAIIDPLV
ncbi:disulfide bond formation protein DsbA [Mesorhizobium sp. Root157]|uniref:DsbA family protein n=1 Tax=Mesorhizobium sp. Root157 TaxID=1736477 RepID=UPI0006F38C0D|nr:DsbA family protein [Mesorhizobium sp. Root157]KQZ94095.1 disulfide bond formation protein DsbA [Mesorhizobium sp. Root157]